MKSKKYIAWMSAACLAFTGAAAAMPVLTVSAATECYDEQGVRYRLDTSKTPPEAQVIGVKTSVTEITIPKTVTLYEAGVPYEAKVTGVSLKNKNIVEKVTIEASITRIPDSAFSNCDSLKDIIFPNTIQEIGIQAFYNCTGLTSVCIPDSVEKIGMLAFSNCENLKSITLPRNEKFTEINFQAFFNCIQLEAVIIPDTVQMLGYGAFENCSSLTVMSLPESVTEICAAVFSGCNNLKDIYIQNPGCKISSGADTFGSGSKNTREIFIHAAKGSTAQTFVEDYSPDGAKSGGYDYGYRFVELEAQPAKPAQGDFDGSGKVDTADAVLFCRFLSEDAAADYTAFTPELADLDGDGLLTLLDVRRLLMLL